MPTRMLTLAFLLAGAVLAGCASTASENTTYARPMNAESGLRIPIN